jgi:uncharacterized protein (DUF305 family)
MAVLCAMATAFLLTSCSATESDAPAEPSSEKPVITGEPAGYSAADVEFATNMTASHAQAVEMAALVAERSEDPAVVQLAADITAALSPEVQILKVLLVQWSENPDTKRGEGGPGMTVRGMVDDATLERMRSMTGADFDRLWLETVIAHHQGAIDMANAEITNGDNVDAVDSAKRMVGVLQGQTVQMQQLLADGR